LVPGSEILLPWLPALPIAALGATALAAAAIPATAVAARQRRLAAIAVLGILALGTMVWQAWAAAKEIARLRQNDRSQELALQVQSLENQLAKLERSTRARSLDGDTAARLADYLRPFGRRTVVVSCVPNDLEAYRYATEIADMLKSANWDASGPETTMMYGNIRAMGVNLFDNGAPGSDTTKILVAAFAKFAIPYQTRVPPGPDPNGAAVELFIGSRPGPPTAEAVQTQR
jgi:hypothetical protein